MGLLRNLRYELSTVVFGLGILSMVLAITYWVIPLYTPQWLMNIDTAINNWMIWVGFLGFLALIAGGYYFIDTIRKEREFYRLVNTTSKEIFVKNQKRIEELAYYHLPAAYERRYQQKRKEFRIKS
jgi:uncharacterized protein DUF3198